MADFNKALTLQSDLPGAIAGRDRMRAALAAVPGAETPAAAPTPVAAAPPAAQAPFVVLGNGDLDRALSSVEETIRLDPKNASAYEKRGKIFENKGDIRQALANFNEALILQSDLSSAIAGRDRMRAALAARASPNSRRLSLRPAVQATPTPVALSRQPCRLVRRPPHPWSIRIGWHASKLSRSFTTGTSRLLAARVF